MTAAFWALVAFLAYTYAGFPALLAILARLRPRPVARRAITPRVSLVIAAYNEAGVIAAKLRNARALDYPQEALEVVVASDGSSDDTVRRAREADPRALVLDLPRMGKANAMNRGVRACTGEVLVFSDANAMYDAGALRELVANFADPEVGGVCGNMLAESRGGTIAGEGERTYWEYDKWLKEKESRVASIVAADGSIYAIRRSLFRPVEDFVTDDFIVSVRVIEQGYRLVFEKNAVSREPVLSRSRDQLRRRVRITEAALRGLVLVRRLMNPARFGWYAVILVSHKLFRRLVPLTLPLLLAVSVALWNHGLPYLLAAVAQAALYAGALAGFALDRLGASPKALRIPYYFCLGNWGTLVGWYHALRHQRRGTVWEPIREAPEASAPPGESGIG